METVLVIAIVLMAAGPCAFALLRRRGRRAPAAEPRLAALVTTEVTNAARQEPEPEPEPEPTPPPAPEGPLVADLLLPASEIVWLDASATADEALDRMIAQPHSAYVIADGDLTRPRGVVGIRTLVDTANSSPETNLGELAKPAYATQPTEPVERLLDELRERDEQLAVTLDDHGVVTGAITVEDILEELVGELHDDDLIAELEPGQS